MRSEGQKQSKKHEDRLAKAIGGQRSAASGAFWSRKGDVRSTDLLIEHKWTGKTSFTVKAAVLEKIVKEAILEGEIQNEYKAAYDFILAKDEKLGLKKVI